MKTNIFKVKKKDEVNKKIVIEEEKTKNPFLLFFKKNKTLFFFIVGTIIILSLLISVGFAFSLFRGSNDYDISYVDGSDKIDSNNDPSIKDDDIKGDLLGDEARSLGIVLLSRSVMTDSGDIISYYTDGTAIYVDSKRGKTYRIFPLSNGAYGINDNGNISSSAKKIYVESTTTTLADGSVITYYTDGTASVSLKGVTIFVRDANNVKTENGTSFSYGAPSGVALSKNIEKSSSNSLIGFTDKSTYVVSDGKQYIVNKNIESSFNGGDIQFDQNNSFGILGEKTYSDGNTISIFLNGSAVIKDKKGNVIYVKKSGDLLLKSNSLYEIYPNDYGYSVSTVRCGDGKNVIYYDDGSAVIIYPDGNRERVVDSDMIIYDRFKNIVSEVDGVRKKSEKTTVDGEKVYNFSDGKSQVERKDGTSYIVDTSKLNFKANGSIDNSNIGNSNSGIDKDDDIIVREVENKFENDAKNINTTVLNITNNNRSRKNLRITIQEEKNYSQYNTLRLDPKFVLFQATVEANFIPRTSLTSNSWTDSSGNINYVIYEGVIQAKQSVNVALSLYVDYANLDNRYQNHGFIGRIKVYVDK